MKDSGRRSENIREKGGTINEYDTRNRSLRDRTTGPSENKWEVLSRVSSGGDSSEGTIRVRLNYEKENVDI